MDVFQLLGKISIQTDDANKALDDTSTKGKQTESKLKKAFGGIGKASVVVGKAMAAGLAVGAAAATKMLVSSVNAAGELEQQLGGSKAVFGKWSTAIQNYSHKAFKTMGLTQAEYLSAANKMGSLLQGSGFEAEEAATLTTQALQRAADVASIMGIDTTAAMDAIVGAAKGNFTMMDNLGVAINDTTLANYALEKGITKSTSKMTTQEKVALAMELFMEKSAYAAGNYAKENETLAGSISTAKAAFSNFLSGAGKINDVIDSFGNAADVIVKNVTKLAPKLATGFTKIVKGLTPKLKGLVQSALPGIIEGAVALLTGLAEVLPEIASVLADSLPYIIDQLAVSMEKTLPALVKSVGNIVKGIISNLPSILASLGSAIASIWSSGIWPMIQGVFKAVFGIEVPDWSDIQTKISGWWSSIKQKVNDICMAVFGVSGGEAWEKVSSVFVTWWDGIKDSVKETFAAVFSLAEGKLTWEQVESVFTTWWSTIASFVTEAFGAEFTILGGKDWETVKSKFEEWWTKWGDYATEIFAVVWKIAEGTFEWSDVESIFQKGWDSIKAAASALCSVVWGLLPPDVQTEITKISEWWEEKKSNFVNLIALTFGIDPPDFEGFCNDVSKWWTEKTTEVGDLLNTTFGIELPSGDVLAKIIADINEWWIKTLVPGLSLFIDLGKAIFGSKDGDSNNFINSDGTLNENNEVAMTVKLSYENSGVVPDGFHLGSGGELIADSTTKSIYLKYVDYSNQGNDVNIPDSNYHGKFDEIFDEDGNLNPYLQPQANGLDFVSRDRMPALLHYGEAVLNRTDAKAWRDGSGNAGMIELAGKMDAMLTALESGFKNINQPIVLDTGVLVGSLANGMDSQLGRMATYRSRRG